MGLLKNYDVLLVDLWGVVHDGEQLYPNVFETLIRLKELKKKVIFLSNVPRRKDAVAKMLSGFGITDSLYWKLVVSGEFVKYTLDKKKSFGTKYFYVGSPVAKEVLFNLNGYQEVEDPKDADFNILTSVINYYDEAMEVIEELIKYKKPLICTNPDKSSIKRDGKVMPCSGMVADKYEDLGGEVVYFGKPHKPIYKYAIQDVSSDNKVLAVGDSMGNDIQGASNANLNSVLVCSGIHRHDLGIKIGEMPDAKKLLALYKKYSVQPTFVVSLLKDIILNT
jgi:HAD superfamily hydrolase (TIGR01459 family)